MARQSVGFVVLAMAGQALAYIYQLTLARLMDPREYAVVLALVSFIAILLFPGNAYQAAVAVGAGQLVEQGRAAAVWRFAARAAAIGALGALVLVGLFAVLAGPIRDVFGFEGTGVLAGLAATVVVWMLAVAARGALQATQRFIALGAVMTVEAGLRLAAAVALVTLGFGVAGAVFGFAVGLSVSLALSIWLLWPRGRRRDVGGGVLWATLRRQLPALPATFAVFGVQAVDVVIANARLGDLELQSFAAAALAGRTLFWGGFVVSLLILPRYQRMFGAGAWQARLVWGSFGLMGVGVSAGVVAGLLMPGTLHFLLVGPAYAEDPELLQTYLVGSALLAMALFLTYVVIAARRFRVGFVVLPIAAAQAAAYAVIADGALAFARILIIGGAVMTLLLGLTAIRQLQRLERGSARVSDGSIAGPAAERAG